jgi:hypothetical protein
VRATFLCGRQFAVGDNFSRDNFLRDNLAGDTFSRDNFLRDTFSRDNLPWSHLSSNNRPKEKIKIIKLHLLYKISFDPFQVEKLI